MGEVSESRSSSMESFDEGAVAIKVILYWKKDRLFVLVRRIMGVGRDYC